MERPRLIGKNKADISSNCGIDFFSIAHILFGYISYTLFYLFFSIINYQEVFFISLFITQSLGLLWEFLENFFFQNRKFMKKKDSLLNSLFDILFVTIGGIISFLFCTLSFYIIISIILVMSMYGTFKYFEYLTLNRTYY